MAKTKMKPDASAGPSSNWLNLQKKLQGTSSASKKTESAFASRKRRRIDTEKTPTAEERISAIEEETSFVRGPAICETAVASSASASASTSTSTTEYKNGESIAALRRMIAGEMEYSSAQQQPGKYLSLDCEMVGVGPEGLESSLARVSLVNYYGAVQLDVFVRQRERVVDYRTQWSGIRPHDLVDAKPFAEVQERVAELLKDRILVGHAVHNDLKALLLSHPWQQTRDTQVYAAKHKLMRSGRPALRHLVQQELGVKIQEGEHSSVTDARATMAVYRLHRKEWEKGSRPLPHPPSDTQEKSKTKRKLQEVDGDEDSPGKKQFPGGGRKGVSSGLSTITTRKSTHAPPAAKSQWWKELGNGSAKGSIRLKG